MPKTKRKRRRSNSKSGYIGVTKNDGGDKFQAKICIDRKPKCVGSSYDTAKQAAEVYDKEAIKSRRPFSKLNFPKKAPVGYTTIQQPLGDDQHSSSKQLRVKTNKQLPTCKIHISTQEFKKENLKDKRRGTIINII